MAAHLLPSGAVSKAAATEQLPDGTVQVFAGAAALAFTGTVGAQAGTTGVAFSWSGAALSSFFSGGTPPYTFSLASGTLPAGLTLNGSTGVVSGTPTTAGSPAVVFRATDSAGSPATADSNSVTFTISSSADTTPPVLSSPVGVGGAQVCSGSVSTNEANGTLYVVVTGAATPPSQAQVKAGQDNTGAAALRAVSQGVTATGTQSVASGAVSIGTTRYMYFMHEDASGNQSTVAASASFSVTDGTPPVLTGTITITNITSTGWDMDWAPATDNVGLSGYDISYDGGATWPDFVTADFATVTGKTPSTTYTPRVRAKDTAGNVSSPAIAPAGSTVTTAASGATITVPGIKAWPGTVQASVTIPNVVVIKRSDRSLVLALTNQTTDASGNLTIFNAALLAGTGYMVLGFTDDGANSLRYPVTAV